MVGYGPAGRTLYPLLVERGVSITVVELTLYAQTIIATTFRPFEFYIATAVIYLVLTTVLTQASAWMERRNARYL